MLKLSVVLNDESNRCPVFPRMSRSSISSPIASSPTSSTNCTVGVFHCSGGGADLGHSLFEACRNGDIDLVRALLSSPDKVNARDLLGRKSTPLHFAAGMKEDHCS